MVRLDLMLFGYRRLIVSCENLSDLTAIFIRSSIISRIDKDGSILVRERDLPKIEKLLSGRINYTVSEPLGLYGKYKLMRHKTAVISGIIFSLILIILLSFPVWDIRISGNETVTDDEVLKALEESGFYVGRLWPSLNLSNVEASVLSSNERISWININRRGTVAYVRVIEKDGGYTKDEPTVGYSSLVAATDCVIEEITVRQGTAVVSVGDVVKKGDALVIGVIPGEGGGGLCAADATVIGRCDGSIDAEISRDYEKKTYVGRKIYSVELNFFNFSLNIFKLYGNLTNICDIIDDEIEYDHPGGARLPFSVTVSYIPLFDILEKEYTDAELVRLATERLNQIRSEFLADKDLLRIRTEGSFTDAGYRIISHLVYLTDVGERTDLTGK